MSDLETGFSDPTPIEEKSFYFTQTEQLNDLSLSQLRDQIKKIMIPLLIKTFQCKLDLNLSIDLPSRLQSEKNKRSAEEIFEQLKTLDNDLKVLLLWCQSCRNHIQKALVPPEEEQKNTIATPSSTTNPAVLKSFAETIVANPSFFQPPLHEAKEKSSPASLNNKSSHPTWWEKLFKK